MAGWQRVGKRVRFWGNHVVLFGYVCMVCMCVRVTNNGREEHEATLTTYNLQLLMPQKKRGETTNECPPNASQLEPLLSKPNISLSSFDYQNNLIYVAQLCVCVCVCPFLGV